jgi:hypothetical protein
MRAKVWLRLLLILALTGCVAPATPTPATPTLGTATLGAPNPSSAAPPAARPQFYEFYSPL